MIKRDYILRWTQELAQVLARMLGKDPGLQLEIIEETYQELLDLDLTALDMLPPAGIIPYLTEERAFHEAQLDFLAEILYRDGKLRLEQAQIATGRRRLQTALLIFEFLDTHQEIYSFERHNRMVGIRNLLEDKII